PTLALNLGEAIRSIRKIRKEKIAVITNSTLINRKDVQEDLSNADLVIAKLDADTEGTFLKINKPAEGIEFKTLIQGLTDFKKNFCGKFALQVMFIKENITSARKIAEITKKLNPDEVQINTPLRPCDVEPLRPDEISEIKKLFEGLNTITVYEKEKKDVKPINHGDTLKRRGKVLG
ncbi:MAG: hypothetical protein N2596_01685, partial [Syntrophorhabdaceae bacterium]|nr:hypothetical protein [Syntrophorhabdaceae bacterium]